MKKVSVETLVIPPIYSNCYILYDEDGHAVVIDPGGIPEEICASIQEKGLKVEAILNTHGHIDHIGGNPELRRKTGAPISVHAKDVEMLSSRILCGAEWANIDFEEHHHDNELREGTTCRTGHFSFEIIHTPGHSPGSVCLIMPEEKIVFSGDLVFRDSIGRYDLPGGNMAVLMKSLREFLKLPDDYTVYPGHGAATTVGRERRKNPYMQNL